MRASGAGQAGASSVLNMRHVVAIAAIMAVMVAVLVWLGRSPICPCGTVRLWTGAVNSVENSQQIADWYTFSHIIHGFLFYAATRFALPRGAFGTRMAIAVVIEAGWEMLENSPIIIDRYREATMAFGYSGDSILNSIADVGWMAAGFVAASRFRPWVIVAVAIAFELFTLWTIRDNLTLNVLMLVAPVDAVKAWQAGG